MVDELVEVNAKVQDTKEKLLYGIGTTVGRLLWRN